MVLMKKFKYNIRRNNKINKYDEMKKRHSEDINKFPFGFAFSDEQFKDMMKKFNLKETDTDKIIGIGAGGFVKKTDINSMQKMFKNHKKELWSLIKGDKKGEKFILDMFVSELNNHEYSFTNDISSTLNALSITSDDLEKNSSLAKGLKLAEEKILKELSENIRI
jgi:hypothetical protein